MDYGDKARTMEDDEYGDTYWLMVFAPDDSTGDKFTEVYIGDSVLSISCKSLM